MKCLGAATEAWRVAVPHKGGDDPTEMAGSLVYRVPQGTHGETAGPRASLVKAKKFAKWMLNPLTSGSQSAIIGAQGEGRPSVR